MPPFFGRRTGRYYDPDAPLVTIRSLREYKDHIEWLCGYCGASNSSSQTLLAFCDACGRANADGLTTVFL